MKRAWAYVFLFLLVTLSSCSVIYQIQGIPCSQITGGQISETVVNPFSPIGTTHFWFSNNNNFFGVSSGSPVSITNLNADNNSYTDYLCVQFNGQPYNFVQAFSYDIYNSVYFDNASADHVALTPSGPPDNSPNNTATLIGNHGSVNSQNVWSVAQPNDMATYEFEYIDNGNSHSGLSDVGFATQSTVNINDFTLKYYLEFINLNGNRTVKAYQMVNNNRIAVSNNNPYINGDNFKIRITTVGLTATVEYYQNFALLATAQVPVLPDNTYKLQFGSRAFNYPAGRNQVINSNASFGCSQYSSWDSPNPDYDGGYYLQAGRRLPIKYVNEYNTSNMAYKIFDYKNHVISSGVLNELLGYDNSIVMLPPNLNSGSYYRFEITDQKGAVKKLRFKYSNN